MELIVFDLDGTLLNNASQISPFTKETLSLLTKKNIAYTLATGRTLHSAQNIIEGHGFHLPHIYSNGVITWDPKTNALSLDKLLTVAEAIYIMDATLSQGITPFITSIDKNNNHFIYHPEVAHEAEECLLNTFHIRPSANVLPIELMPSDAQITNISMLGKASDVDSVEKGLSRKSNLISYSGPALEGKGLKWMDIHHSDANKGDAVELLKQQLNASKIICFGDNDNDLSMFELADECYAPENANDTVKAAASSVIGHHHDDGVALYLRERFNL
ncbi:MAG: Cof subfamily protein (haloacid dehalogenase superfamily) [Cellvibrionaceae bacterium]|jgi:Cof subfamily protein (haloacid dehalogenase superfamily)